MNRLVEAVELARDICAAGHSIRSKNNIRARQPLNKITVILKPEGAEILQSFPDLKAEILKELNIKELEILQFGLR